MRQNRSLHRLAQAILVGLGLITLVFTVSAGTQPPPSTTLTGLDPAIFIENAGQFASGARFMAEGGGRRLWLADDALWITVLESPRRPTRPDPLGRALPSPMNGVNLRLTFEGAQPTRPIGIERGSETVSYILGRDPAGWRTAVPVWSGVRYPALYPGVDLELGLSAGRLQPRLVCAVDCARALGGIRLRVDGATALTLEGESLVAQTPAGDVRLALPVATDRIGRPLAFDAAALVPDAGPATGPTDLDHGSASPDSPTQTEAAGEWLEFIHAGYLGGSGGDIVGSVAADAAGNTYLTGDTLSVDFPTTPGAFVNAEGKTDIFVTKLAPDGDSLIYSAVIGGDDLDSAGALSVGPGGAAFVGGYTDSGDFPLTDDGFDDQCDDDGCPGRDGGGDGFIVRLSPNGDALTYGSYFGGSGYDAVTGLVAVVSGNVSRVTLAGDTESGDLPVTAEAFDTTFNDKDDQFTGDGFAARLNLATSTLEYATYLGGRFRDNVRDLALSLNGAATIVGSTMSPNFPTTPGAFASEHASGEVCAASDSRGCFDGFVIRLNATGAAMEYGTFLGGFDQFDSVNAVALSAQNVTFVTGETSSDDFPVTPGAFDISHGSGGQDTCDDYACPDAFVVSLNAAGSRLNYGTFLGGSGEFVPDWAEDIIALPTGQVVVVGHTESDNFPVTPSAWDKSCDDCLGGDGFITRVAADGRSLTYSTYFGGSDLDVLTDIAAVSSTDWTIAGFTYSPDFPASAGARDGSLGGGVDGVVARLQVGPLPASAGWLPVGAATGSGISGTPGESAAVSLDEAADGSLIVAWSEDGPGDSEIYVKRWNGSNWASLGPGSASGGGISNNDGESESPVVLATPDGIIVAWSDTSSGDAEIYARRWNGTTWVELGGSAGGQGISNNKGESLFPGLAMSADGPIVAWSDDSAGNAEIYVRRWDGKAWRELGRGSAAGSGISKNSSQSVHPSVAVTSGGEVFVAWTDDGGGGDTDIYVKRFTGRRWMTAGANSATGEGISQDSGRSRNVDLAAGAGDRITAAWTDDSSGVLAIYVRTWDGTAWREVGRGSATGRGISFDAGGSQAPSVLINKDAQPIIAWYDTSTGNAEIYVRRWNGTRWQEVRAGAARGGGISDNGGASSSPSLAWLGETPVVAWADNTAGNYEVYVRRAGEPGITCYRLQRSHTGAGADPTVSPAQSPGCSTGRFVAGAALTLTAAPAAGNVVLGWSGTNDDTATSLTNSLTMPAADHVAVVAYGPAQSVCYPLTLTHTGQGADPTAQPTKSTGCPTLSYKAGAIISLTAAPAVGNAVVKWTGTNDDASTTITNKLTMPALPHTVSVSYEQVNITCYALPLQYAGKGDFPLALPTNSQGCALGRYKDGEVVELLARPANGWRLWRWSGTNDDDSNAGLNKVTVSPLMDDVVASYRMSFSDDYRAWVPWSGGQ